MPQRSLDLPTEHTLELVTRSLGEGRWRLLEVGCGTGDLALRLVWLGHAVTGLEPSPAAAAARAKGLDVRQQELSGFDGGPFDAVLFTRSLHHIPPAGDPIGRAAALLRPNGLLILEEFDVDYVDLATASWFYDVEAVLAAAGLADGREVTPDPLARWRESHLHEPPLQTGDAMMAQALRRFNPIATERVHYLYRHFWGRLRGGRRGTRVARSLHDIERRMVADGLLRPVGLRFIGRLRGAGA